MWEVFNGKSISFMNQSIQKGKVFLSHVIFATS